MSRNTEFTHKGGYIVNVQVNGVNGETFNGVHATEVTHSSRQKQAVKRFNPKLGRANLSAPSDYTELKLRCALRVEDVNVLGQFIAVMESLKERDYDTCNIMVADVKGVVDQSGNPSEQVVYSHQYYNCRLTDVSIDPLNRRGDDDFVHIDLSFQPRKVAKISGSQVG